MNQLVILVYILIASHSEQGATPPTGPWPDGHIRIIRDIPVGWDFVVDGVRK